MWASRSFFVFHDSGGMVMLVLTRRLGEEIVIGGDIRVKVLQVNGDKVRLGITAPACIAVDRQEVHERRAAFGVCPDWVSETSIL
jgi:carbon storage regulator